MEMESAETPQPPYYAVIFSNVRTAGDNGYDEMADKMSELAKQQKGYLGQESSRGPDGFGITVSYWADLESIKKWKNNSEHLFAQEQGKKIWYRQYMTRICKVERDYKSDN